MHHNPSRMVRERHQNSVVALSSTPSATAIVDSPPPANTSVVDIHVPTSTTALAVVVAVLASIILLGVGICIFVRRRNAKKNSAPSHIVDFSSEKTNPFNVESKLDLKAEAYGLEKPIPVFIPGVSPADMNPNWVPQIPPNHGAALSSSTTLSSKKSKGSKKSLRSSRGWDKTFSKFAPSERSPPPSYISADTEKAALTLATQVPLPPSPPHQASIPPTPPTPPAKKKLNPFSREIPPAKPVPSELPPLPLPSPARSASFAVHQSTTFADMERAEEESAPRLMNVVCGFTPNLDDELLIQIGETVRVLEEFQDGWALVQRVGRIDAPKGVVPRTCLAERERLLTASYLPRRL